MPQLLLRGTSLGEVDAVLFDKDGTLSISEPKLLTLAAARVFFCLEQVDPGLRPELQELLKRAYGLLDGAIDPAGTTAVGCREHNLISTATALAQVGLGWPEALAISEAVFAATDRAAPSGGEAQADIAPVNSPMSEGLRPLLEALHGAGLRCAVISNDDVSGIQHFLNSHGLTPFFTAVWSADHRPRKPDPGAVHGLCAQLGVEAPRCALIGDANSDLGMAVAAGIPHQLALGYTAGWSSPPPLAELYPRIHHWRELAVA